MGNHTSRASNFIHSIHSFTLPCMPHQKPKKPKKQKTNSSDERERNMLLVDAFLHNMNTIVPLHMIPTALTKLCFVYFYIPSIDILIYKRKKSKKLNDLDTVFDIERLIVFQICAFNHKLNRSTIQQNWCHIDILTQTLYRWVSRKKLNEFKTDIVTSIKQCIENDNILVFKVMLKYCEYNDNRISFRNNDEIIEFINVAAKYASFNCISLLLQYFTKLDWRNHRNLTCLYNAIKYHQSNLKLINLIITQLESTNMIFVCDDIMKEVIRFDLVDIAKRIIENRWHQINEQNELQAQLINGKCFQLFCKRSDALRYYQNNYEIQCLTLDDSEWGDTDNSDDFYQEFDWQNAQY